MKFQFISAIFIFFFLILTPTNTLFAQQLVKPDLRNYDALVADRLMPSQPCLGKTPTQWVAEYVGFNELAGGNMKFSNYLFEASNQVDRAAKRLAPKIFSDRAQRAVDEQGNPVAWVGEICWYQDGLKPPIIGEAIIESETPITQIYKKLRDGNSQLSAFNALYHIPLSGGTYNMQKPPLSPDPNRQSECPAVPSGVSQSPTTDKGQGKNTFASSWGVDIVCALLCECKKTQMYIRTDSLIPHSVPSMCLGPGCTDEQNSQVDSKSGPTEMEKNTKGWMNAVARPGLMDIIIVMVEKLTGTITGKVPEQVTKNAVNEPIKDSSYYTTMGQEMSMKFTNCKLFPFAKRAEMPECKTNWLANLIGDIQNQLGAPPVMVVEPNEATPSPTLIISE